MKLQKIAFGVLLVSLLAACGSRSDDDEATLTLEDGRKVPSSALASASAYSQYAASLVNTETGAAVVLDADMVAPKSESEAPIDLR
jgi:major membrane immunogen (membrane-anchored lipoprotein)